MSEETNGKITNRRYKLGLLWAGLININFYVILFMGKELDWVSTYAGQMTLWFAIIIGGLTLTDLGFAVKDLLKK